MNYELKKIILEIDDKDYYFNFNFNKTISKELSYIIKNNLYMRKVYLIDIIFKKNRLISGKLSNKYHGKEVIFKKVKINNNYYKENKFINLEDLNKYNIIHLNQNKENYLSRKYYNKLSITEFFSFKINIPLYLIQDFYINLLNIYLTPLINIQNKVEKIYSKEDIIFFNKNGNFKNMVLFIKEDKANNYLEYQKVLINLNIKNILIDLKYYLNELNEYSNNNSKYIYNKLTTEENGFLTICGFTITNNIIKLITINEKIGIIPIKIINNQIIINDKKYNKNIIDNVHIHFHKTLIDANKMITYKINMIKKEIDFFNKLLKN